MVKYKVKVIGKAPLLMNRFVVEPKTTSRAKKVYVAEEEAEKKTYRNADGKLILPNTHFKTSMVKASTDFKMTGKKTYKDYVRAGIFIDEEEIILEPQKYEIFACPVVIQRARVMSWRPMFKEWSCEFTLEIADEMLDPTTIKQILETAGRFKGGGDYRPDYGRFIVQTFKKIIKS